MRIIGFNSLVLCIIVFVMVLVVPYKIDALKCYVCKSNLHNTDCSKHFASEKYLEEVHHDHHCCTVLFE